MAIFHLRMKKSKRGSKYIPPAAHLDYINRDEKYGKKEDLLFKEVRNLTEEFNDIKDFWKCAETYERKNSNLYKLFFTSILLYCHILYLTIYY